MMYVVKDQDKRIRTFKTIERMETFMKKRSGVYFVIENKVAFLVVTVVKSENCKLTVLKTVRVDNYL